VSPAARVRVKICGITRAADAHAAAAAGADAIGLVFAASSPRRVAPDAARAIAAALPPFVAAVGVFAGESPERVREIASEAGLSVVQVHGDDAARALAADPRGLRVIAAARLASADDARTLRGRFPGAVAILCDSAGKLGQTPFREGGTGVAFPWEWLVGIDVGAPLVLAGGLTPENVAEAARRVRPWAVDVSTGVESAPGVKDAARIAAFVGAVRGA